MSGSETAAGRVGRVYTAARRHPWVLGRLGDWRVPLGPYTPAQLVVAVVGALLLIKTFRWWSWMGPVPVVAWLAAVWTARRSRIAGRSPAAAIGGWAAALLQPPAGRIGGRPARDRRPRLLHGAFVIESGREAEARGSAGVRSVTEESSDRRAWPDLRGPDVPASAVERLLASGGRGQ